MPMQQLPFEKLVGVLETTRGTPVTPPDHYLNLKGEVVWDESRATPEDNDGLLTQTRRSVRTREWSTLTASGAADVLMMPWLANLIVKGGVSAGTHPTVSAHTGVLTYAWLFQETLTADDIATATMYFGDPNVQMYQSPFSYLDSLDITGDGAGTGLTTVAIKGMGAKLGKIATPSFPSFTAGPLIVPNQLSAWLDTGATAIGTTTLLGKIVSAKHSIPSPLEAIFLPNGPGGAETITTVNRVKRDITTTITCIVPDSTLQDLWEAETLVKLRVDHNGPLIETITGTPFYHKIEVDTYGKLQKPVWGVLNKGGRTVTFTITSEYQPAVGGGWTLVVWNTSATL